MSFQFDDDGIEGGLADILGTVNDSWGNRRASGLAGNVLTLAISHMETSGAVREIDDDLTGMTMHDGLFARSVVLDRDGVAEPYVSWKDSVNVPKHGAVRIAVRFEDFAGKWMFHCHILDHEDMGMMGILLAALGQEVAMRWSGKSFTGAFIVVSTMLVTVVAVRAVGTPNPASGVVPTPRFPRGRAPRRRVPAQTDVVARGRFLIITHACGECHGGGDNPAAKGWLAGSTGPAGGFKIGPPPCGIDPKATGCFTTRPRNLTPDDATGMGRFTERQLFNALRYGLRPEDTPDVTITSTTPGKGNFPTRPHYLAPPMPWPAWRHMPDADLRAIAAYLKRGLKPVVNKVPDSEGPPDFWASAMTPEKIGIYPAPAFPTANEQPSTTDRARVLRGRALVIDHDCAGCHEGASPAAKGWLAGITSPTQDFVVGPCFQDEKAPCFHGRAEKPHAGQGNRHRTLHRSADLQCAALRAAA